MLYFNLDVTAGEEVNPNILFTLQIHTAEAL